jgi:signal transduction histidine kinase/CheY-like chemotaxis protein
VVSLFAAACVFPLGRVPDWDDLRPLTWVAITAALASAANIPASLDVPASVHIWTSRLEVTAVGLHILAWLTYLPGWAKQSVRMLPPSVWPLAALALSSLVPGVVFGSDAEMVTRSVPWLGVIYRDPAVKTTGILVWSGFAAYALWGLFRAVRWSRAGAPYPRAHLSCMGALFLMGAHDAAVMSGLPIPTPYLLDFAFYIPVGFFGLVTLRRIADASTEYHRLRSGLEAAVADRSRMLEESRAALNEAGRTAVGRFAAGVGREVKQPASSAAASLELLAQDLAGVPDEVLGKLEDARAGVRQVISLSRQLQLAGSSATGANLTLSPVRLATVLEPAVATARARAEDRVALRVNVSKDLWARAHQDGLVELLTNLLVNAVQAIPGLRGGTVAVQAVAQRERILLAVNDDGVGMSDDELRHVFDPYYGTKPPGMGSGLGLAAARSLAETMQGSLRFESAVGRGSRAVLELARAAPPAAAEAAPPPPAEPSSEPIRANLLVIDDDAQVLSSMARLLGRQHVVRTASGVQEGLAAVAQQAFDMILCDVMMPRGGGERFWAELLVSAPAAVERLVFMTGGAATREAREFLRRQPRPVLIKPFDVMAVNEALRQLDRPSCPGPDPARSRDGTQSSSLKLGRIVKR